MNIKIQSPIANKIPHATEVHGTKIVDDYHWLRDAKWPVVEDQTILDYLKAENDYTENILSRTGNLRSELFEELKSSIKLEDQSPYVKKDDYYYYQRTIAEGQYAIYCRKKGKTGTEEVILDHNAIAQGKKYASLGDVSVSPDHRFLAYSIDESGGERYSIKVLDLDTMQYLDDHIVDTIGGIIWHEKLSGFFYTPVNDQWRSDRVLFHTLSSDSASDQLILQEYDQKFKVHIYQTSSLRYLIISVDHAEVDEIHVLDMTGADLASHMLISRDHAAKYHVQHHQDYFYLLTNDTGSNFRLARARIGEYPAASLEEFIPLSSSRYLSDFSITKQYLLLNYYEQGLPILEVEKFDTGIRQTLPFDEPAYTASIYSTNFIEDDVRVDYSSLKTPPTTYLYNLSQKRLEVLKIRAILGSFNVDDYETRRLWVENGDVKVPVSLVYKKSLFKGDGSNPLYLKGYGSYGIGYEPSFRQSILPLLDRGFIYGIAHIRGGDDLGYKWYEDAKYLHKKRTFEDFIAVSEALIRQKYTKDIIISGGSAGGMLMGVVLNMRPELYKAAIAHVPFVDVLNTMLDHTLPLTPGEYNEWGNPQQEEFFHYISSYSPYENVKAQNYPHLLVTGSISDPRVGYWEPAKWVAKLRAVKTDDNSLMLHTELDAGHGGASGRFDYLKEIARDYAYILMVLNLT